MPRNYRIERDAIIQRWYGGNPQPRNPRPSRTWKEEPIAPADCFGIPMQVNSPFNPYGNCMVWKYTLNTGGYGTLTVDGKPELAHRAAFIQTRGHISNDRQVNHLCNRPYCVQPSHLYAGTTQDNKDDSQIFSKEELLHAPWIFHWPGGTNTDNPLLRRLVESDRFDGTHPWEPVKQPAQKPLEEFICPRHDFAITMFSNTYRICRICETSEFQEEMTREIGAPLLISEICPASQTVIPILEKIFSSDFAGESHRKTREKAYHRRRPSFRKDSHELRNCECEYCTQDRRTFRASIQPLLTKEESDLLDVSDWLEPQITTALQEASAQMMEAGANAAELNEKQTQLLKEHLNDCTNTRTELAKTSRTLESQLAYLLYALAEFNNREEMLEDQIFQQVLFSLNLARARKEDKQPILETILPTLEKTTDRLTLDWKRGAEELTRPYLESKPELHQDINQLAQLVMKKQILEHLRYELLGRNTFNEQIPHPHSHCVNSIRETGRVEPFPRDFKEGTGYTPRDEE